MATFCTSSKKEIGVSCSVSPFRKHTADWHGAEECMYAMSEVTAVSKFYRVGCTR